MASGKLGFKKGRSDHVSVRLIYLLSCHECEEHRSIAMLERLAAEVHTGISSWNICSSFNKSLQPCTYMSMRTAVLQPVLVPPWHISSMDCACHQPPTLLAQSVSSNLSYTEILSRMTCGHRKGGLPECVSSMCGAGGGHAITWTCTGLHGPHTFTDLISSKCEPPCGAQCQLKRAEGPLNAPVTHFGLLLVYNSP